MATDFTQDTVLHFLQSSGGSVKNSDLLLHFRNFIREHPNQDRNRELFKKFVNSVATVQQVDGVSYVVVRKKFRGHVPGGGERKNTEPSAVNATQSPGGRAEKPRQKAQLGEVTEPAAPGVKVAKTVLPAAGIIVNNNNNNVETNFNLKQQRVTSTPEASVRPAEARVVSQTLQKTQVKTPSLSEPPAQDQHAKVGQHRLGGGPPPGITPVVAAVRHNGDPCEQVPVPEPLRGRQACLQPEGGLRQGRPPPPVSLHPQVAQCRIRHRQSYKAAVSYDEDEGEDEETPMRQGSAGGAWPLSAPLGNMGRAISASSPCIIDQPAPPSVVSSSSSSSERKLPKIYIQDVKGEMPPTGGPDWSLESGVGQRGQWAGPGLEPGSVPGESTSTRRSLPLEAERYLPFADQAKEAVPHHNVHMDSRYLQPAGVQLEPRQGPDHSQMAWLSSSHSSIFTPSPDAGISSRGSQWNSSCEDLQARTGTAAFCRLKGQFTPNSENECFSSYL